MLPLIIAPNPILRKVASAVPLQLNSELKALAKDMFDAMQQYRGIGLAAPQIGQSIRLIIIATPDGVKAYFNPEIIKQSWKKTNMEEGCLSLPGVFGIVRRPGSIKVRYTSIDGVEITEDLNGMTARIYQHEVDHLNGILFIDRTSQIDQGQELLAKYGAV